MLIHGTKLTEKQRAQVKDVFHYMRENDDLINKSAFYFIKDGSRLAQRACFGHVKFRRPWRFDPEAQSPLWIELCIAEINGDKVAGDMLRDMEEGIDDLGSRADTSVTARE